VGKQILQAHSPVALPGCSSGFQLPNPSVQSRDGHARECKFLNLPCRVCPGFKIMDVVPQSGRQCVYTVRGGLPLIKVRCKVYEITKNPPVDFPDRNAAFVATECDRGLITGRFHPNQAGALGVQASIGRNIGAERSTFRTTPTGRDDPSG
jgi:hypothetical protein